MHHITNKVLIICISYALYIYAKLSSGLLREREAAHMKGTVFTLAKLKIVSIIRSMYHIQCQCVDELSSSV